MRTFFWIFLASGVAGAALANDVANEVATGVSTAPRHDRAAPQALVDALDRRARALDEREHALTTRETALQAAEARLGTRLDELEAMRARLDASLAQADAAREARVAALVTMVESNRAGAIAPVVAGLDDTLAVEVLDRMNRQKAGKLLAALPPDRAAALATRLTRPVQALP